jgi:hypothetical protein
MMFNSSNPCKMTNLDSDISSCRHMNATLTGDLVCTFPLSAFLAESVYFVRKIPLGMEFGAGG